MTRELSSLKNLLFDPSLSRRRPESSAVREKTSSDLSANNVILTGSFRFDPPGSALKSTQQLNLDFSRFENHTFFGSAQSKVQKAFGKIINAYPFDGSKSDIDTFLDGLTGFEKHVFDNFPHALGYLIFSGSTGHSSAGSYISVKDFQGTFSPDLSNSPTGKSVIDFGAGPFTSEFFINVPSGSINENSIIVQKIRSTDGLTIALSSSYTSNSPKGEVPLIAILSSGTMFLTASMTIPKGSFQHCAIVMDRSAGAGQLKLYKNSILQSFSSYASIGQINFITSPLTIGSGTNATAGGYTFVASSTLSGAIDELRFWHKAKNQKEIYDGQFQNAFSQQGLVLAYRFNEPSGSYSGNGGDLVLDYSGNGLHARISNFKLSLKDGSSFGPSPLVSEDSKYSPVLFPSYNDVTNFNSELLLSASDYDYNNPNLVTKLIPRHYLLESQITEGFASEEGDVGNSIVASNDQPGGAKVGQAQIISSLLYTMSETFDELKCFVDEFKRLLKVDYLSKDTISDQLLPWLSKYYGIKLTSQFISADMSQLNEGQNVTLTRNLTEPLQKIQNAIWRRIFSDMPKTLKSRGTMESLKSTLRNLGVNSDGPVRIRELGGASSYYLGDSYLKRHEIASMLDFSGSFVGSSTSANSQGFYSTFPYITSSYLTHARTEPGIPLPGGPQATGTIVIGDALTIIANASITPDEVVLISTDGTTKTYIFKSGTTGNLDGTKIIVSTDGGPDEFALATNFAAAIASSNGHEGKILTTVTNSIVFSTMKLTQATGGYAGQTTISLANVSAGEIVKIDFAGTSDTSTNDNLLTSGSWSFEGTYKFLKSLNHPTPQSLVRMMTTGTSSPSSAGTVLFNLIANSEDFDNSVTGSLQLYGRISTGSNVPSFVLQLTGVNIFDGDKWQVSFGRDRGDLINSSYLTSSYFLRASKFTVGGLESFMTTSSFINELTNEIQSANLLQNLSPVHNASGSFLVIGNQSLTTGNAGLNASSAPSAAKTTRFTGKVSGLRFWSKGLTVKESKMHAMNFKSLGVEDPQKNFNFVNSISGSYQKLRSDVSIDQNVTMSDSSGNISLLDFSQNGLAFEGKSFESSARIIKPERFDFMTLSPDFKSENPNKVRIRSFLDNSLVETYGVQPAPLYRLPQNEQPKDDKRVQIEISAVQALNEDMMNIFATLDALDNAVGGPELVFSQDYPALRNLRRIYFNRLTDKVNFSQVFQFFKWFDETIGDYLEQMLPYDSKFLGTSFVVEPHALERPKFIYNYYDMYLGEENRGGKELLLLQQFVGNVRKF